MARAELVLCATCAPEGFEARAAALGAALDAAELPVVVRVQDCLNACGDPVSLGLQGPGLASYIFTGVDPEADHTDILATLRTYLDAPQGWIEDARPCGRLRLCLRARMPALNLPK